MALKVCGEEVGLLKAVLENSNPFFLKLEQGATLGIGGQLGHS